MRLAYLCNLYPAVSHSFVRREIEGVERAGHSVERYSLRPAHKDLRDPADIAEGRRTVAVLSRGIAPLFFAAVALFFTRPRKTFAALAAARQLSTPGLRSKARHSAYWLEAAWLVRRLAKQRIDHLHAHFGTNPAAVAMIAHAWGGPPYSFTVHGPDEFDAPITLALPLKIQRSKFVAGISSYGRSQLMRWSEPDDWSKITVVGCGLDEGFLEAPVQPIKDESRTFVCVARLSAQKGLSLLISACGRLRDAGETFTVTIIGDGELRQSLQNEIDRLDLKAFVTLAGTRSASEIRDHLLGARAFVLPSFAEGLPVVLMEALALSRPVITTAIAGIPELVDENCGWLIPAGSEDALVEAMTEALRASSDELLKKGAIGRGRVRAMHDADKNGAQIAALMATI